MAEKAAISSPHPRHPDPAFHDVKRDLVDAPDRQIEQVVAMIDGIQHRGAADGLIAPLRPRLALLRPARPLRFHRLLFEPLDPVIVPIARWRPGDPTIPRTTLTSLAATVWRELGSDAVTVERQIKGKTTSDASVIADVGATLWPRAAAILRRAPTPAAWDDTGLGLAVYPPLARMIGAVLRQIPALTDMIVSAAHGVGPPDIAAIASMLREVQDDEPLAQPTMVALLLARVSAAGPLLVQVGATLGRHEDTMLRRSGDRATTILLEHLERPGVLESQLPGGILSDASADVRRLGSLLRDLDGDGVPPERRARLRKLGQRLDASCQARFRQILTKEFLKPMDEFTAAASPDRVAHLETVARGLRELETEARAVGGAATYDQLLRKATDAVRHSRASGTLDRMDMVRLVEILSGPEAALMLL